MRSMTAESAIGCAERSWRCGALVLSGTASAQISVGGAPLKPQNAATGSIPPANQPAHSGPVPRAMVQAPPPAPATPAPPWSGEDGASGHPLMTASAIREAAANFESCVAGMWSDAARRNITRANFERFTAGLQPDLRIMDLMDSQPEFTKSIWDYLDILVNDTRMAKGREVLAKYKPQFDAVEKLYGVDRYIIASIWGVESNYSTQMGDRSVLQSTATLGLHRPPPEIFQGRVSYPRWKSSTAATCARSRCAAHGPARSARRSSCRPRSSATRWTPTATAAATWSTMPPT